VYFSTGFSLASRTTRRYHPALDWGKGSATSRHARADIRGMSCAPRSARGTGWGMRTPECAAGEGYAVYVACSTLCFSKMSLEEALRTIGEMQSPKADLAIHDPGPHISPAEVATDVGRVAQRLKAANLPFAAFPLGLGCANSDEARRQLRAV